MHRSTTLALLASICLAFGCNSDDGGDGRGWLDDVGAEDTSVSDTNRRDTLEEDTMTDGDSGPTDWSRCSVPSDCVLADNSCCGVCGQPELENKDAVNQDDLDEHFEDVCPEPGPCPACASQPNPYLVASCQDNFCQGYDVRQESFTECSTDDDCRLRVRECCECGGTTDPDMLIAISQSGYSDYSDLVCDPGTGCPECVPVYPDNATAVCGDNGHCEVEIQ